MPLKPCPFCGAQPRKIEIEGRPLASWNVRASNGDAQFLMGGLVSLLEERNVLLSSIQEREAAI